jgi:hypothetical protein
MRTGETPVPSAGLEGVQRRFERWRGTHEARSRIPDALWAAAVRAAGRCGIHRTSKALRLDYYSLKERVEEQAKFASDQAKRSTGDQRRPYGPTSGAQRRSARPVPAFLELAPAGQFASVPVGGCECTLELEDTNGAKMRVHVKAVQPPDLAAISQSFWNRQP